MFFNVQNSTLRKKTKSKHEIIKSRTSIMANFMCNQMSRMLRENKASGFTTSVTKLGNNHDFSMAQLVIVLQRYDKAVI